VDSVNLPGYHVPGRASSDELKKTAAYLAKSKRPVLYVGHGSVIANAGKAIYQLAEKLQAPIVNTLLGKGAVAEDKPLHLGMLGMLGMSTTPRILAKRTGCGSGDERVSVSRNSICISSPAQRPSGGSLSTTS
jgi:acetolactate synthase-1/2/3 large subunit